MNKLLNWRAMWARTRSRAAQPALGAAQRFASLLAEKATAEAGAAPEPRSAAPRQAAALFVASGLHRGAHAVLRGSLLRIGRAADNDIVLRDAGIGPSAARLAAGAGGWVLLAGDDAAALQPQRVQRHGPWLRARYQLGPVALVLSQRLRPQAALAVADGPRARRVFAVSLGVGVLATAVVVASLVVLDEAVGARVDKDPGRVTLQLADAGFAGVVSRLTPEGRHELAGYVATDAELERLRAWSATHAPSQTMAVHSRARLLAQAREAITGTAVTVADTGPGVLRFTGSGAAGVHTRIRALAGDLRGAARIEDAVTETPAAAAGPHQVPMPLRIVNVAIGTPSYFQVEGGGHYFVGGRLPDGAEVVAIEERQIRFRHGDRDIVFPLD